MGKIIPPEVLVLIFQRFTLEENRHWSDAGIAKYYDRDRGTIARLRRACRQGMSAWDYHERRRLNMSRCGRKKKELSPEALAEIKKRLAEGWSLEAIANASGVDVGCKDRTLYRKAAAGCFDGLGLDPCPNSRKRRLVHDNRGRLSVGISIHERGKDFPNYRSERGHFEVDTIVGAKHASAILTAVETQSRFIVAIKTASLGAADTLLALELLVLVFKPGFIKSITIDNGKEFAQIDRLGERHGIKIYVADPGRPGQKGLIENSNALLRRDGLSKGMDFSTISQREVAAIAQSRNNRPRHSLSYVTPLSLIQDALRESI